MLFDAYATPAPFALVWSGSGFHVALLIAALTVAATLGVIALRDRRRCMRCTDTKPRAVCPRAAAMPRAAA